MDQGSKPIVHASYSDVSTSEVCQVSNDDLA